MPCRIPTAAVALSTGILTVSFVLGGDGGSPITAVQYERDGTWVAVSATSPSVLPEPIPGTTRSSRCVPLMRHASPLVTNRP